MKQEMTPEEKAAHEVHHTATPDRVAQHVADAERERTPEEQTEHDRRVARAAKLAAQPSRFVTIECGGTLNGMDLCDAINALIPDLQAHIGGDFHMRSMQVCGRHPAPPVPDDVAAQAAKLRASGDDATADYLERLGAKHAALSEEINAATTKSMAEQHHGCVPGAPVHEHVSTHIAHANKMHAAVFHMHATTDAAHDAIRELKNFMAGGGRTSPSATIAKVYGILIAGASETERRITEAALVPPPEAKV